MSPAPRFFNNPLSIPICKHLALVALTVLLQLVASHAHAGRFLDYIRSYDLNDYALGLAITGSENPYLGSDSSLYAYPYLTSFNHSAFTDDWFLIRGENIGIRFVNDSGWEAGLVARVQTLGQGVSGNDELAGITDRNWTVETGPLIGWRGWPVNVQFRTYWEIPQRHGGTTSELEFSLPRAFERGFFVPAVRVSYLSSDYSQYYFGVRDREATPSRPEYQPGSATNLWAGLSIGYRLNPLWLLNTSLGFEQLDSSISASPLVDRDQLWSATVGFAYNADVFSPRDYQGSGPQKAIEFRIGAFNTSVDTDVQRNAVVAQRTAPIDLEDLLGAADQETVLQLDASIRLGYYHRLQLGYFRLDRRSTAVLLQDLDFGGENYPAGTEIGTDIESLLVRLTYAYSLIRDDQKELGVMGGLSHFRFDTTIGETGSDQPQRLSAESPLPTIGAFGSLTLGRNWHVDLEANLFALDFDRYNGTMSFLRLGLERQFGETFSAGLGYDFYRLQLKARDEDLGGKFTLLHQGPRIYVGFVF
jgi:outer membrane protein